jgi:serine phosphatase RsbU (regulator of sigma subunit)/CHASE3 domain sensor protein
VRDRRRDRPSLRGLLARLVAVLALVLGVLIAVAVMGTVVTARDYRDAAQLALDRQSAANQLLIDLLNAETGNRGYTLTGRGDYLQPYTDSRDRYEDDLARLRGLVRGQTALEQRVDRVDEVAQLWFAEASELIRLRRQGRVDDAVERINQGVAKQRIDAFRAEYGELALQVLETRRESFAAADRRRNWTLAAVVAAAVLALVVVLGTSRRVWVRVGVPINLVAAGVGRMARGRFSDPVPVRDDTVRELWDLTGGFNTMQRQVLQQRDAVAAAARREAAQRTERRLWETVQHGLLPSRLPGYPGYRLVARYRPAERALLVGGDFFDAEVLPDGRLAVIVGDMAGHGAPAAAQAAGLRFGWRTMVAVDPDPTHVLAALNAQMARQELRVEGLFATVIYALVDRDGRGVFASGGHPPPLVLRADGCHPIDPVDVGPLLGVMDEAEWPLTAFSLGAGETLVLYTDGLIEARRGDELFGLERACEALWRERAAAVEARVERVVDAARRHDDGSLRDDVVVLALEHVRALPHR